MNQWLKTSVGRRSDVPAQSGVYVFAVNAGFRRSVIYVGQAKNLQERINQHFSSPCIFYTRIIVPFLFDKQEE